MSDDLTASVLATLNQTLKAIVAELRELNATLASGEDRDDSRDEA